MKILLIAYHFPPLNDGGVRRAMAICKYLPLTGHAVNVLTQSATCTDLQSEPGIMRVLDLQRGGNRSIQWFVSRVAGKLASWLGFYNSPLDFWRNHAMAADEEIVKRSRPDVILATYPPVQTLELGLHFSKTFGIRLISDFRDGLLFEPIEQKRLRRMAYFDRYSKLERETALHSSAIVTVSEPISDYFRKTYGARYVHTIPNGYDPDDFANLEARNALIEPGNFNLVHTGSLSASDATCDIRPFLRTVEKAISSNADWAGKLRVHFIGFLTRKERREMAFLISKGVILIHGVRPRDTVLQFQREADLLLLVTSLTRASVATGKIFEYLKSGRPILALTHDTYAAQIVRETQTGWVVHPQDFGALLELFQSGVTRANSFTAGLKRDENRISFYSRVKQIQVLSELLTHV